MRIPTRACSFSEPVAKMALIVKIDYVTSEAILRSEKSESVQLLLTPGQCRLIPFNSVCHVNINDKSVRRRGWRQREIGNCSYFVPMLQAPA